MARCVAVGCSTAAVGFGVLGSSYTGLSLKPELFASSLEADGWFSQIGSVRGVPIYKGAVLYYIVRHLYK